MSRKILARLVLQLRIDLTSSVSVGCCSLMLSSPARPGHHEAGACDRSEQQARDQVADFRHARQGDCGGHHAATASGTPFVRFTAGGSSNLGVEPGEECECGHAQAHVTMPSMPGARFAVVEPQFLFGALEAFLDGPAQASGTGQLGQLSAARANTR